MSCKSRSFRCSLIWRRVRYGSDVDPEEVSRIGYRATLKSPPSIVRPAEKPDKSWEICLKKLDCAELGL